MDKGQRVRIERGRTGKGVTGTVFWKGENRYGDGDRLGVKGDDGETYWVNSVDCDPTDAKAAPPQDAGPVFQKGDRVRWTQGGASGAGRVFWTGQSRHGPGMRYGVEGDDGETRWLDGNFVEPLGDEDTAAAPASTRRDDPVWDDDAPDDGYLGSSWQGGAPPDLGDEPPPPEPPGDWSDEDAGWS